MTSATIQQYAALKRRERDKKIKVLCSKFNLKFAENQQTKKKSNHLKLAIINAKRFYI